MTVFATLSVVFTTILFSAASPREEISLSGTWQVQMVGDLDRLPADDGWSDCAVPGYLRGVDYRRAWFRRSFTVPESMRGKRIKLAFGGVKYNSRVLVNGKHVGGCFGGYRPFEVDVTETVRFGEPNELLVGCHDWTGVFTPGNVDFGNERGHRARQLPRDKILSPVGGRFSSYGIWDDVLLRSCPAVYVQDLFIKPSVRRGELVVDYTLANESASPAHVTLRGAVEHAGNDVLALPPAEVDIPAGATTAVTIRHRWPNPRCWSHVDPYLYHLRSELSSGDVLRTRFGFREFWTEGPHFYLNGTRVNLLATSWWPPDTPMSREEVRERWAAIKNAGCIAFRTHTQPWRPVHYDLADEMGLLVVIEGAVWNDDYTYRIDDPVFWKNYAGHLKAMVDRDKNRPSVVMWSLENEFFGGRLNDTSPAKDDLVRMGRLVKQCDPTRPILYESDGDPGGVADVVGIHYPHEYPKFTCWPNEAYWLEKPQPIGHVFHDARLFPHGDNLFVWPREKPLYIGEFLWLPSRDPSWHTVFFGDDAYRAYREYRNRGKGESWKMQILGYRHLDVAGISPWTVIEGGRLDETNHVYRAHRYAYQPIAAFCHDYDTRFYSGEKATRRVEVFNDAFAPSKLELNWTLSANGNVVSDGKETLELGPAEHRMLEVSLPMPKVDQPTDATWRVMLYRDGKQVFADTHAYRVWPRIAIRQLPGPMGLYDPRGATRALLERQGLALVAVESLDRIPAGIEMLILGSGTLDTAESRAPVIGRVAPAREALFSFVKGGGRAIVLRQSSYPKGLFDVALTDHRSTMTFPLAADSPLLSGIAADDLKFWRGDHIVTDHELHCPAEGGALPIIVSGSASGLDHTALVVRPAGRGCFVHTQMRLVEKFSVEPAAARLLDNVLQYASNYSCRPGKTALVGGSEAYREFLKGIGLRFDDLSGKLNETDLSDYRLVLCREQVEFPQKLHAFAARGGNVMVHRAGAQGIDQLREPFDLDLALQSHAGSVSRVDKLPAGAPCIPREDLYWLGEHRGIAWATTPRADDMIDGVFTKTFDGKQVAAHEIETWNLSGKIVERREPGVTFATAGEAVTEIDFPAAGTYVIGVRARGTPCLGQYPLARVSIDGKPLGVISVASDAWGTFATFGRVEKGRHKVSVAFINDRSNPPEEDRNLTVDQVLIARDDRPGKTMFLTDPPAVAAVRVVGSGVEGGLLLLDQVQWDTEERNTRKAARYAAGLLTQLGGDFVPKMSVLIECEAMSPQPGMKHFRSTGTYVSQACNGELSTPIEIAVAGRYTLELTAAGTSVAGVYPLVDLRLDGRSLGRIQLTTGGWRSYPLDVTLPEGSHRLTLVFTNDLNRDGEDRNVMYDRVEFSRSGR